MVCHLLSIVYTYHSDSDNVRVVIQFNPNSKNEHAHVYIKKERKMDI